MKRISIVLVCTCLLASGPPRAQAADNVALAKKHFNLAETHYQQADFRKALAQYKRALAYKRLPALLFNIAQCHRQLNELRRAIFYYRLFLAELPRAPNKTAVRRLIKQLERKQALRQRAERRKGKLTLVTEPKGAQVWIDRFSGPRVAITPAMVVLKEGQHLVVIRLAGFRTVHRTVTVSAQGMALLNVTLESLTLPRRVEPRRVQPRPRLRVRVVPADPHRPERRLDPRPLPAPRPAQTVRTSPYYKRWWFWTFLTVGAGLVVTGGVFGVSALDAQDQWQKTYDDKYRTRGETQRTLADVFIGAGALSLLGVIIGAAVVGHGKVIERRTRATLVPGCDGRGCGLWVKGRF